MQLPAAAGGPRPLALERYDSKGQNEEALSALRAAIDDGAQVILQGNSSATAAVLIEAINKHNEREPNKRVIFLNYSAVDPILTNEKCSFWHFRFDAHADMRMAATSPSKVCTSSARTTALAKPCCARPRSSWPHNAPMWRWWATSCTRWAA